VDRCILGDNCFLEGDWSLLMNHNNNFSKIFFLFFLALPFVFLGNFCCCFWQEFFSAERLAFAALACTVACGASTIPAIAYVV